MANPEPLQGHGLSLKKSGKTKVVSWDIAG
jgi:hypothetical protein